jgi:hypothetical protein
LAKIAVELGTLRRIKRGAERPLQKLDGNFVDCGAPPLGLRLKPPVDTRRN